MPQAIAYGLGAVFTTASAATITVAAYAITIAGTLALSSYQKRKAERVERAQFDSAQVDRLTNIPSTVAPRELVLGRVRKGGHIFFKSSVGQYKELFIMCVAVASHEIDGIEQVYFNNQPVDVNEVGQVTTAPYGRSASISAEKAVPFGSLTVTLDNDPIPGSVSATESPLGQVGGHEVECSVDGRVVTLTKVLPGWTAKVYYQYAGFNSFVNIRWHLGSPDQTADGAMTAMLPGIWTWDHRARGVAYLVCSFAYNDGALPSGIPTVTVRMRGARVYDPRLGGTAFSENPALLMRHVLTHPQFGKRTTISAAEETRIIAAANACDTAIDYGAGVVPMFRASLVAPFGAPARDVLDDLAQSMAGEWAYAAGEFYVRPGVYQLPVMTLTDADLAVVQRSDDGAVSQSPITISPHQPRSEKFNTVAIRIWDEAANYIETPLTPYRADALVAADRAELSLPVTMPAVFHAPQAFHIAGIMLRDSRDPMVVTLPFKMRAYPLEIFDGVRLELDRYGFAAKEFRIVKRVFSPLGFLQFTLKETTAAIYAYGAAFLPGGYAPNTNLPKPWEIYPPTLLSVSSGESELVVQSDGTILNGVRVTWAPIADQSILGGGSVELDVRVLPDGAWSRYSAPGDATELTFTGMADSAVILLRLRTRNSLTASDWGTQVMHQVIGKTEPPPDIENLTISGSVLSWSLPRRVPDLAGFVFRFHYGNRLDWTSAAPLHTGLITASPYDLVTRPGGVVTIMGKAQDTSGNQSQATANIVMNLGDPPIANVIEQWDFRAQGWPTSADRGPLPPGGYAQYSIANIFSSVRSTTATYWAGAVLQTAGVNEPRFEGGQLLVEPARTNALLRSQEFDNAVWAKVSGLVVTPNTDQAPDGTLTMDTLTGVAATTTYAQQIVPSLLAATSYAFSVYVKAGTSSSSMVRVFNADVTIQLCGVLISWAAGVPSIGTLLGAWAVNPTLTATPLAGVYRLSGGIATGAFTALALLVYPSSANAATSAKFWGASLEVGSEATSYIPTTGAPAARAADTIYVSEGQSGYTKSGADLVANALDSFYGTDDQSFYKGASEPFYGLGNYAQLIYVTPEISVSSALAGSVMTLEAQAQGVDLRIEYRLASPGSFYGPDTASFYDDAAAPMYGPPGAWVPWPGQMVVARDAYQFRVILGAGSTRAILQDLDLVIDAPDLQEVLSDVPIAAAGTVIPYAKPFSSIKAITATLQANGSGAETLRTDKSNPLAPVIRAYNAASASVSGATADIVLQGY